MDCAGNSCLSSCTSINDLKHTQVPLAKREAVERHALSPQVQVGWITSGDHSLEPTKASGLSEAQNWARWWGWLIAS